MIAYLVVLTLLSWAALLPMLRIPHYRATVPDVVADVPVMTFDSRGLV